MDPTALRGVLQHLRHDSGQEGPGSASSTQGAQAQCAHASNREASHWYRMSRRGRIKHQQTYAKTSWIKMDQDILGTQKTANQPHQANHSAQKLTRNGITLAFPLSVLNLGQNFTMLNIREHP